MLCFLKKLNELSVLLYNLMVLLIDICRYNTFNANNNNKASYFSLFIKLMNKILFKLNKF